MSNPGTRRLFLRGAGSLAIVSQIEGATPTGINNKGDVANAQERVAEAFRIRREAALYHHNQPATYGLDNRDEAIYPSRFANFSKALPHDSIGEVHSKAYIALLRALDSGLEADFQLVPLGGSVKLVNPQAAFCFDLVGADSHQHRIAPSLSFASRGAAGEMVEAYWQALTRDIPFSQYGYEPGTDAAIQDLNRLSAFLGPLQSGRVTPATLFRGTSSGDLNGPYLSQFLWKDVPYGAGVIIQKYSTPHSGIDFLTSYDEWLAIQNGQSPPRSMILDDSPRFIRNARDLTWYVHQDFTYQAYLNACQILLHSGNVGLSRSNPYSSFNKESAFVTFGAANILEWIGSIASAALRAAWCQKWLIHRRLRPEEFGGRVYQRIANSKSYPIHAELLNSAAIDRILTHTGNALLPIAYPEGSPTHPSYPAGHAAVAGACVTALKAFFDESAIVEGPVIVSDNGDQLHPYTGAPLTVGDELNKLASNMSIARNAAGVHYRSDGTQGLLLGENVAIEMLRDIATTYSENFPGFTFRRFDGTQLTIPA